MNESSCNLSILSGKTFKFILSYVTEDKVISKEIEVKSF